MTKDSVGAVVHHAVDEANRFGERKLGTDHLLLGLLHDEASAGLLGVNIEEARKAVRDLDLAALAVIGLDLRGLDLPTPPPVKRPKFVRYTLTAGSRAAIAAAVAANGGKPRGLTSRHLLRTLLDSAMPDPAAQLLEQLGIDVAAARARVDMAAAA